MVRQNDVMARAEYRRGDTKLREMYRLVLERRSVYRRPPCGRDVFVVVFFFFVCSIGLAFFSNSLSLSLFVYLSLFVSRFSPFLCSFSPTPLPAPRPSLRPIPVSNIPASMSRSRENRTVVCRLAAPAIRCR